MQIIHSLTNDSHAPLALTIGHFDGVHIGHQTIIRGLVAMAREAGYEAAAMTFSPHAKVFFGNQRDFLISSDREKADVMAQNGIQRFYQIPFNDKFSAISPTDFIEALIQQLQVKYLLVGDDFRFGYRGQGDFALLEKLCRLHDIGLDHTPTVTLHDERVSSSRVRDAIKNCDFALVAELLGRPLCYRGEVIKGNQLGRTIDFPTANVRLPIERLLPDGVFAVTVRVAGSDKVYSGMSNIGTKPTVDSSHTRQIETHLFDFTNDLYGNEIEITPVAKLRSEQKFSGVAELTAQLHRDKEKAMRILQTLNT